VTAFHKDYKMTDPENTPVATLLRACEIGTRAGLRFVYAGNLPGRVGRWEHTYCPDCGDLLIERRGYVIKQQRVGADGRCPSCSPDSRHLVVALVLTLVQGAVPPSSTFDSAALGGIQHGVYPGAVLVVGRHDTILFAKGYGHLTWSATSPAVSVDSTFWDVASLTKVVATTPALML